MNHTESIPLVGSTNTLSSTGSEIRVLDSIIHYLDVGAGEPIVFLHGNPTSSHLWRNIIPHVAPLGRCLAPDLVGMGRSGKSPANAYRFEDHARYLDAWFDALGLTENVTLVLHDWGSALGFHWAFRHQNRVRAIAYMEAIVQPLAWTDFPNGRDAIFRALRSEQGEHLVLDENVFVETVFPRGILRTLTGEEMEAYREPFKHRESRRPTLAWPRELPIDGQPANIVKIVEAYGNWLSQSPLPKLFIAAEPGALLAGRAREFCLTWPNQSVVTVKGLHFVQEDSSAEIGTALHDFVSGLPAGDATCRASGKNTRSSPSRNGCTP